MSETKLYKHQQEFIDNHIGHKRVCLYWDCRCLHPDTEIYDPVKNVTKKIKDIKGDFNVYSKTKNGRIVIAKAESPKKYGVAPMIEITFSSGEKITTTPFHRVWTGFSFFPVSQLIFSPFPLLTTSVSSPYELPEGVLHYSKKLASFLFCYRLLLHLCDLLFRWAINISQGVFPSKGDVRILFYSFFYRGDVENKPLYNLLNKSSLLSKIREFPQNYKISEDELEYYSSLIMHELFSREHQKINLAFFCSNLLCKVLNIFYRLSCKKFITIREIRTVQSKNYYDFHVPLYNNYLLNGLIHHNTGKSIVGQLWLEHRKGKKLVICIKKNKKEWQERCPLDLVYTKEEVKKVPLKDLMDLSAILIDECHFIAGSLYIAKTRSSLSERIYNILKLNPRADLIMLSATPVTNAHHSLHTLMTFLGIPAQWQKYQSFMAKLVKNPFLKNKHCMMWMSKPDWRIRAKKIMQKYDVHFHRIQLKDCVKDLPKEIIRVEKVKGVKCEDPDHWTEAHLAEQKNKTKWVLERNFDKLIVACHYREQVEEVSKALAKHRNVYTVYGATRNPEEVIAEWKKDPFGYLVISSSMGEAFDGYSADALIFMSLPHRVLSHTQMKERLTTLDKDKMKPKLYFYLIGGSWDQKIYKTIVEAEDDFNYNG